jgi:hypothetical protein
MEESTNTWDVVEGAEVATSDDWAVSSGTQKGLGPDTEVPLRELTSGLLALKETVECKLETMVKLMQLDASNRTQAEMVRAARRDAATKRRHKENRLAEALSQLRTKFIVWPDAVPRDRAGYLLRKILLSFQCDETYWAYEFDIRYVTNGGWSKEEVVIKLHMLLGVEPHVEEKDGKYGFSYPDSGCQGN